MARILNHYSRGQRNGMTYRKSYQTSRDATTVQPRSMAPNDPDLGPGLSPTLSNRVGAGFLTRLTRYGAGSSRARGGPPIRRRDAAAARSASRTTWAARHGQRAPGAERKGLSEAAEMKDLSGH
jgi:hypothetical protein